jgi:hypothetical protein
VAELGIVCFYTFNSSRHGGCLATEGGTLDIVLRLRNVGRLKKSSRTESRFRILLYPMIGEH